MMTLIFLSLAVIIAIVVILVSAKFIKAGFDARSEVRDQKQSEDLNETDENVLERLKDKNLSEEDLKNLYEEIKNKDKEDK